MKKFIIILLTGMLYSVSISTVQSLEDKKEEFGFYFGTKIYEERH